MTFREKLDDALDEGRKEGRKEGQKDYQDKMRQTIKNLRAGGKNAEEVLSVLEK